MKKYINGPAVPPSAPRRIGIQPRKSEHLAPVVDAWLATEITVRASVIHERLVADHGFPGSSERVKLYVAEARPRIAAELGLPRPLSGLHRRLTHTGQLPDWTTLVVTGPTQRVGRYGRTWFDWSATVETHSSH